MNFKVLYLHSNTPDYLADSLFHGLRTVLGDNCVDVPRYDCMYHPLKKEIKTTLRGNGFTLYGLLQDFPSLDEARDSWMKDLKLYDLIIIADIGRMYPLFRKLAKEVPMHKLAVLDGSDSPAVFPYLSGFQRLKKDPSSFFIPVHKASYYKRELTGDGESYNLNKIIPRGIRKRFGYPAFLKPISFSIPSEKIKKVEAGYKEKLFNTHIVDEEVAENVKNAFFSSIGSDQHYFDNEEDYYEDLQKSKFGITTKRMGWDCLRHYELAANGCVICFKNLDQKFPLCAPHGLNESNSISYTDYGDLMRKIHTLTPEKYEQLLNNTYHWINDYTTEKVAERFIKEQLKDKSR